MAGVSERHLETVLPARGGKVVVVRGSEKGVTGKLLAKDREKETALIQVQPLRPSPRDLFLELLGSTVFIPVL